MIFTTFADWNAVSEARRVSETAKRFGDEVDYTGRFPFETFDEIRTGGLLAALVPQDLGGPEASTGDVAKAIAVLAEHCASSALVLAMHQIQVAYLLRHAKPAARDQLIPRLLAGDLLLASANSEVGLGGDRRSSLCALEARGNEYHLEKNASTLSYGEYADAILATARRGPDSSESDQVIAICLPPNLLLKPTGDWNTLGLRGTCSRPAHLVADVRAEFVIEDYASVFARTSVPLSAIFLSAVWHGLAEGAARRAHRSVRERARAARKGSGSNGPTTGALRLAELGVALHQLREVLNGAVRAYDGSRDSSQQEDFGFTRHMDDVKVTSSTLVLDIVLRAMAICGTAGYQNDSEYSLGRILRDAAAAPLMVNNDRALLANTENLLLAKEL